MSTTGEEAEELAAQFLIGQGLTLIKRNYRCRFGEIDIILRDGKVTVFAEVRLRSDPRFGGGEASVSFQKQQRLIAAAQHYLATQRFSPPCRFDVIALDRLEPSGINWIKNAFGE